MFEAGIPEFVLGVLEIDENEFLTFKSLKLLNLLLIHGREENQQKILDLLMEEDRFFTVFFYIQSRIQISKDFIISNLKTRALKKFIENSINEQT